MIQLNGGFLFQSLYVYPNDSGESDARAYRYLPLEPQPETSPQGHPTVLCIPTETGGFLQMGTHLGSTEASIEALRLKLAACLKLDDTAGIDLQPGELRVSGARLQIGSGADLSKPSVWEDLASSTTSGFYPFTALFHLQLNADQQTAVTAALSGQRGFLQVRYDAVVIIPAQAKIRIFGDVHALLAELHALTDPLLTEELIKQAERLLDQALDQGRLNIEDLSTAYTPVDLYQRAYDESRRRMLDLLLDRFAGQFAQANQALAEASADISESVNCPLDLVTDVATWFGRTGADHIVIPPGS